MKNNNRVLHIITGLGVGGAEKQLLDLVRMNLSHSICSLSGKEVLDEEALELGIKVWNLNMSRNFINPLTLWKLRKVIKSYQPEIIHAWMYHSCFIISLYMVIFNEKIPIIWGIRCSDMDTKKYSFKLKVIIYLCKILSKKASCLVYNSYKGRAYHKKLGFHDEKSKVILNGINLKRFIPHDKYRGYYRKKLGIKNDETVIINVARVDPMKGHDLLLKSFNNLNKLYPKLKLVLIGKDTEQIGFKNNIIALGVCEFIEKVYNIGDIIISTSYFGEGFSNALAEGMVMRLIPVATSVGDSNRIIGNTGFMVHKNNNFELEKAIIKIMSLNKKEIENKKNIVRKRITENFSLDVMISSYKRLYRKLK